MTAIKKTKRVPKGLWFGKLSHDGAQVVIGSGFTMRELENGGLAWLQDNGRDYEAFFIFNGTEEVELVSWEPSEVSS